MSDYGMEGATNEHLAAHGLIDTPDCESRFNGYTCQLEPYEHERDDWHEHTVPSGARLEWSDTHADRPFAATEGDTKA